MLFRMIALVAAISVSSCCQPPKDGAYRQCVNDLTTAASPVFGEALGADAIQEIQNMCKRGVRRGCADDAIRRATPGAFGSPLDGEALKTIGNHCR